mmetsp:Transcript_31434/g.76702  ORF Transcript_31434/g.76702 Transcript_31434/m.76702 type:complete len:82 (+) Transcript_31434:653-898(+)
MLNLRSKKFESHIELRVRKRAHISRNQKEVHKERVQNRSPKATVEEKGLKQFLPLKAPEGCLPGSQEDAEAAGAGCRLKLH